MKTGASMRGPSTSFSPLRAWAISTPAICTPIRVRSIPLTTPEVAWAFNNLLERAATLGATAPYHYLFPVHVTQDRYNPLMAMTKWGLRKPWEAVRAAAGVSWLRMYDLRHTAIT